MPRPKNINGFKGAVSTTITRTRINFIKHIFYDSKVRILYKQVLSIHCICRRSVIHRMATRRVTRSINFHLADTKPRGRYVCEVPL